MRTTLTALLLLALVAGSLAVRRAGHAQVAVGAFASTPVFDARGAAFAVFGGGSVSQLESAAQGAGATGVWAQDRSGAYQLLVVSGPAFLRATFTAAFPAGFTGVTALTLVRPEGGPSPTPAATPTTTPTPAATPTATPTPAPTTYETTIATLMLQKTNEQRIANGLGTLTGNAALTSAATGYARVVFTLDPYLSNVAAVHALDGQPWDRATRAGYAWAAIAENVAAVSSGATPASSTVAPTMVEGWMNSPPHRASIVTPGYVDTGIGCAAGRPAVPRPGFEFAIVCVALYGTPK